MRGNLTENQIEMVKEPTDITEDRAERVRQERIAQNRARVPLGQRNPLKFREIPGYVLRVINDNGLDTRVQDALAAGYAPVTEAELLGISEVQTDGDVGRASPLSSSVRRPVGKGVTGILMKIKKEWYDEDQAKKQAKDDAIQKGIVDTRRVGGHDTQDGAISGNVNVERY